MGTNAGMTDRTGREYLRVSYDRSGVERSPDEQHNDNERDCSARGIKLAAAYREAGSASASRYARKSRDDFERLLEDLGAGRFGADVLVLWESSRGSRRVGEWVTLIELCEEQGVTIFVTTHGREYDPANPRDRRSLLEDAVDSEYESAKVSARARRASAANAAAGNPHGRVPFGYVRRYDERSRKLISQEPHPDEAPIVQELFTRLAAGHSLKGIARDFAERGILNDSGRPFTPEHMRTLALNPTYAGIRIHNPGSGGGGAHYRRLRPGVSQVAGTWPALVSKADFLAVQRILDDPRRVTTRGGKAKHLLSLIAKCDVCGGPLTVTYRGKPSGEYQCGRGHVRVDKAELDDVGEAAMLEYLARPDVHDALTAGEQGGGELTEIKDDLAHVRSELDTARTRVAAGELSVASFVVIEPGLLARIAELESREAELMTPSALRGLITPGVDVAVRWQETPLSARRRLARLLLARDLIGELRVARRPRGTNHHVPARERVRFLRKDQAQENGESSPGPGVSS